VNYGSSFAAVPSRRERLRAQTLAEIRKQGYAQIAKGGATALSLNGIAKAMGMTGPALYRYVASHDALLTTLVTESYENLADALTHAAEQSHQRSPEARFRVAANAYREWALAQPHRYQLVFGSSYGLGELDPERITAAAHRAMGVVLVALAELALPGATPAVSDVVLRRQLAQWSATRSDEARVEPGVLLTGLLFWTRMHGIVSLEIEGFFAQGGVDPGLLYQAEIDHLIAKPVGDHADHR